MVNLKGPWHVARGYSSGKLMVLDSPLLPDQRFKGQVIANETTCPNWEQVAKLIAAAPELLAACQVIVLDPRTSQALRLSDPMAFRQLQQAIDKATK